MYVCMAFLTGRGVQNLQHGGFEAKLNLATEIVLRLVQENTGLLDLATDDRRGGAGAAL